MTTTKELHWSAKHLATEGALTTRHQEALVQSLVIRRTFFVKEARQMFGSVQHQGNWRATMTLTQEHTAGGLILTSCKIILISYKSMASGALFQGRNDLNANLVPTVTGRRKNVNPYHQSALPCPPLPRRHAFAQTPLKDANKIAELIQHLNQPLRDCPRRRRGQTIALTQTSQPTAPLKTTKSFPFSSSNILSP